MSRATIAMLRARVKTLESDLCLAIVNEREAEAKASAADVVVLPVPDGLPGEIDVFTDGHSHHYVPTSYVAMLRAQMAEREADVRREVVEEMSVARLRMRGQASDQ
jgi:hypothetical protein